MKNLTTLIYSIMQGEQGYSCKSDAQERERERERERESREIVGGLVKPGKKIQNHVFPVIGKRPVWYIESTTKWALLFNC